MPNSREFERKERGDPILANDFNELQEAVRRNSISASGGVRVTSSRSGTVLQGTEVSGSPTEPAHTVDVYNPTDTLIPVFAPMGIASHFYTGDNVKRKRAFNIRSPLEEDKGRFLVAAEPLLPGRLGKAWIDGIFPVLLQDDTEEALKADVEEGSLYLVASDVEGAAHILWQEAGSGTKLAVVRFVGAGSGDTTLCALATTTALGSLSGTPTIDGEASQAGDFILVKNYAGMQAPGIYEIPEGGGTWTFKGRPNYCIVLGGDENGELGFFLDEGQNPRYKALGAVYKS